MKPTPYTEADIKTFARQMARRSSEYRKAGRHQEADLIVEAAKAEVERMRAGEVEVLA